MTRPPCFIKEAKVINETDQSVVVKVQFGSEKQCEEGLEFIHEEKTLEPKGQVIFSTKEYDMGSWKAIAPVHTIFAGENQLQPKVDQLIPLQEIRIGENNLITL